MLDIWDIQLLRHPLIVWSDGRNISGAGLTCRQRLLLPVSRGDAGNLYWRERAFGDARNLLPNHASIAVLMRRGRDEAKGPSRSAFA